MQGAWVQTGSKFWKGYNKGVYYHPVYLTCIQSTSCEMPGWMNHMLDQDCQVESQLPQICTWYHCNGRRWRGTKELLLRMKEEREKAGLKLNLQNMIVASGPITSWQIEGEKVGAVTDFILGSSKVTVDGDCSREVKTRLLLGRKAMTNLDNVLKTKTSLCCQRSV